MSAGRAHNVGVSDQPETQIIWQYDSGTHRHSEPEHQAVLTLLNAHGINPLQVPASTTLTAHKTPAGRVLKVFVMDEGFPPCPTCEACISGTWQTVPLQTDLPQIGWHRGDEAA